MSKSEDNIPIESPYSWSQDSFTPLEDFVSKYRPSMVQNDGTKPWIWVRGSQPTERQEKRESEAIEQGSKLLKEFTEKVEAIKNDASIPVRSNKKTGAKSKKEVREQVQAEATEKLKEVATKNGYVSGKWLIFAPADKVDKIWKDIATSLVSGPLASTFAFSAKVATSPEQETSNYQHIICLYLPDVYDKDKVTEVMKILLRNHGLNLSGVKSNLYTALGIDSKHPSGIPSTVWKNTALLDEKEIKELKDAFFSDLATNKTPVTITEDKPEKSTEVHHTKQENEEQKSVPAKARKVKPKPKKKASDDPFASDDDNDTKEEAQRKEEIKTKKTTASTSKKRKQDNDYDDDERPSKKNLKS